MADVNKDALDMASEGEDEIGVVSIEGFSNQPGHNAVKHNADETYASVYLGETLKYDVIVERHANLDPSLWKKHVSRVSSQATISPYAAPSSAIEASESHDACTDSTNVIIVETNDNANGLLCPVLATFVGNSISFSHVERDSSSRPYFRGDDVYVIPMSSCLQDLAGDCHYFELRVVLWLYTVCTVMSETRQVSLEEEKMSNGTKDHEKDNTVSSQPPRKKIPVDLHELFLDEDDDDDDESGADRDRFGDKNGNHMSLESPVRVSSSSRTVQEKTVTMRLRVQGPPELRMRHSSAGQKQLILLAVSNNTEKQMVIKSIQMLSSSTPVHDVSMMYDEGTSIKWESCHQLINLECPKRPHAFPVILSPCEEFNLVYRLHLSSVPSDSELSLRANVKWTHAGASNEITTVYKLPRIKIRCPPFIVTVKCDEEIELGKSFFVTYSISNQLHDFMSMRLYYNLDNMVRNVAEHGGTEEEKSRVQHLKDSVVCHDPDTAINSCPRGTCVPIRVGFQIHKPGLYELSELMKVNLRYSLPDTQLSPVPDDRESRSTSSDTSISFQSTDDHLQASEDLWRGRSGSTTSLATPVMFQSAEERRRSFASKSYSFGDLGPTVSADSDEVGNRNRNFKRSSAVPPPRPPPPRMLSQTERDLIRPSNFLKQPFYIYVKDPLVL